MTILASNSPKGLGMRKKQMSATVLVPGLKISVDGVGDAQSRVVAKSITFSSSDLGNGRGHSSRLDPNQAGSGHQPAKHCVPTNRPLKPTPT